MSKNIIKPGMNGDIVIVGFPHDTGVAINGGRVGSALGPERFRFWLNRLDMSFDPEKNTDLSALSISDAGDIPNDLPHEEAHAALSAQTLKILQAGGLPFVVGGGNDQSYPNAAALLNHCPSQSIGVINIDAHLDVRPLKDGKAHSGSPFRLLLEDMRFRGENLVEFACQGIQCSKDHAEYAKNRQVCILWLDHILESGGPALSFQDALASLAGRCQQIFISFDLDSVCDAPGVSCPAVVGLSASDALSIAEISGRHPQVRLFDLSEYNPMIESERTGRLAAAMFYRFCLGFASRKRLP